MHACTLLYIHVGENEDWNQYVHTEGEVWRDTILAWTVHNLGHPVAVFQYEDLLADTEGGLRMMLEFLRAPYDEATLRRVVGEGYSEFKRQRHNTFNPFTQEQRSFVKDIVSETMLLLFESEQFGAVANFLLDYV